MGPHDFPVIPSEAARRAAQSRDLFLSMHQQNRSLHYASLRSASVGKTGRFGSYARLKSSVSGCSGLSTGRGSGMSPGEWPIGKKRERRRASASLALTGMRS